MILDVLGAVARMLAWACVFVLLLHSPLCTRRERRQIVRAMGRALWALVKVLAVALWALLWAPAFALMWAIRRFDEIEDRRRDWQLDHARQCRGTARLYRNRARAQHVLRLAAHSRYPAGLATADLLDAHADQLDRLAELFEDDAADADEVDAAWRDSLPEVAERTTP
jgi:hypothetical protein